MLAGIVPETLQSPPLRELSVCPFGLWPTGTPDAVDLRNRGVRAIMNNVPCSSIRGSLEILSLDRKARPAETEKIKHEISGISSELLIVHVIQLGRDSVRGQPASEPSSRGQRVISLSLSFPRRYNVFCYLLTLTSRGTAWEAYSTCGCPRVLWEIAEPPRTPTQRSVEEAKSSHTGKKQH